MKRHQEKCKVVEHKCEVCNKVFHFASQLLRHQKTHEKEKHKCKTCSQSFTRIDNFKKHVSMHHQPTSSSSSRSSGACNIFSCKYCDKSFAHRRSMMRHQTYTCSKKTLLSVDAVFAGDIAPIDMNNVEVGVTVDDVEMAPREGLTYLQFSTDELFMVNDDAHRSSSPRFTLVHDASQPSVHDIFQHSVGDEAPQNLFSDVSQSLVDYTAKGTAADEVPRALVGDASQPLVADAVQPSVDGEAHRRMSNAQRSQKKRLTRDLLDLLDESNAEDDIKVGAVINAMNRLQLKDQLKEQLRVKQSNRSKAGRKQTAFETRLKAWERWHTETTISTITNRPAKLRTDQVPKIQKDLPFESSVRQFKNKRNVVQFVNMWRVTTKTYVELHQDYLKENPNHYISYGVFIALKPFYVRPASDKELSMCLCKLHTHTRRSIECLVSLCKEQEVSLEFDGYKSFFEHLQKNCPKDRDVESTYLSWECTPHKAFLCEHQILVWTELDKHLSETIDKEMTKKIILFVNKEVEKDGEVKKVLTVEQKDANIVFLLSFIRELLPKIVNHRNLLRNFRTLYTKVLESFRTLELHVDFSENLTLHLPEEITSMYWGSAKTNISIHSGLMRQDGEKIYHPYLSDDLCHDQSFVYLSLREMIMFAGVEEGTSVIVTSDNCSSQYKSAKNFDDLQRLADEFLITIIRIYGVAGHGKNEVDSVGGTAKIAIRTAIARKLNFFNAGDCLAYLNNKFANSTEPSYEHKLIPRYTLIEERLRAKYIRYPTVKGSSCFNVLVFKPNSPEIQVAPRLCACDTCLEVEYGSCPLFEPVSLQIGTLNEISLRSGFRKDAPDDNEDDEDEENQNHNLNSIITGGSICAIAADDRSSDTVWFVYVDACCVSDNDECVDSSGHLIPAGYQYLKCFYLEKHTDNQKGTIFKKGKKTVFVYKECIVHPLVTMEENYKNKKDHFFLDNTSYVEVLHYVQYSSLSTIQF